MNIEFKKLKLEDRNIIEHYLEYKKKRSCELVFSNVYLWSKKYPTEYAILNDTLVFQKAYGELSFVFPIGPQEKIKDTLDLLQEHCNALGVPFRLHLVQQRDFEQLEEFYPGQFDITYDRDSADYVYESEKLITLSGKKYHGKRNHINKFKELNEDWSYEKLSDDNIEDCFQMAMKWRKDNGCDEDEEKRFEMCVALNSLRLYKELGLVGGLIRVDRDVVAFTVGEPLGEDMFVVHIEKAYADVQGAYPIMNQQFIEHEASQYAYINREEDTGAEGLRKAKLSYRPIFLIEKGKAQRKQG